MTDSPDTPDLEDAARVLSGLSREDRDELLESLIIAVCANPEGARRILGRYIVEHDFQALVGQLDLRDSERGPR